MSTKKSQPQVIIPTWSVNNNIHALSTTRKGGVSQSPYDELNVATHVKDNPEHIKENRRRLKEHCALPNEPSWLEQIHSDKVIALTEKNCHQVFTADGSYTIEKNIICCVMTADCMPVLFCNHQATWVAAVHAGWKGIANGILKNTVHIYTNEVGGQLADLQVWIGPAIGAKAYQVGQDVKDAFIKQDAILEKAFTVQDGPKDKGHFLLNSSYAAQLQLIEYGLEQTQISTENFCTYQDNERFYSYRRDGIHSGRMATMIWLS